MAIVYQHIRLDKNEVFYIGIGKTKKRAYSIHDRNEIWNRIVCKSKYKVEILFNGLTWKEACDKEIELIAFHGRKNKGTGTLCNMTDGGDGVYGLIYTEEHKKKISISNKGRICSDETRKKISNSQKGKKIKEETKYKLRKCNLGKKMSEETKTKISNKLKNRTFSQEHKNNLSKMAKIRGISKSTREKLKKKLIGSKLSEETKRKMSENNGKSKKVIDRDTGNIYYSKRETRDKLGISVRIFEKLLKEGTRFQYYKEELN